MKHAIPFLLVGLVTAIMLLVMVWRALQATDSNQAPRDEDAAPIDIPIERDSFDRHRQTDLPSTAESAALAASSVPGGGHADAKNGE